MMCYKDMTYCNADCLTILCPRKFTEEDHANAYDWWGDENYPVAFSDLSEGCPDYTPLVIKGGKK
jgi:hypothetical protein